MLIDACMYVLCIKLLNIKNRHALLYHEYAHVKILVSFLNSCMINLDAPVEMPEVKKKSREKMNHSTLYD